MDAVGLKRVGDGVDLSREQRQTLAGPFHAKKEFQLPQDPHSKEVIGLPQLGTLDFGVPHRPAKADCEVQPAQD